MSTGEAPEAAADPDVYFTLQSSDGQELKISSLASQQSKTLKNLLASLHDGADFNEVISMDNIKEATLLKIIEWCEHNRGEPVPDHDEDPKPGSVRFSEWDKEYLEIDCSQLFDLIVAADYLNIRKLLVYATNKVALMGKGKSPEQMRVTYMIPTDEEDEAAEKAAAEKKKAKEAERAAAAAAGETGPSASGAEAAAEAKDA
ncbi:hypothetical protein CRE_03095 [Caenorhabditis remanei]|uniref:Skp1-related protein n=1 Tax=Caenorhabditis remanei TaxID=31234 RepID=E3LWI4_CAERE|nr:hypothetical protein CRE_03095 [Caenorhabditis remanei]